MDSFCTPNPGDELARTCSGEKGRGLSARSPSPHAPHPNPRLHIHRRPRRPPERDGGIRMTPFQKPQAEGFETEVFTKCAF